MKLGEATKLKWPPEIVSWPALAGLSAVVICGLPSGSPSASVQDRLIVRVWLGLAVTCDAAQLGAVL